MQQWVNDEAHGQLSLTPLNSHNSPARAPSSGTEEEKLQSKQQDVDSKDKQREGPNERGGREQP